MTTQLAHDLSQYAITLAKEPLETEREKALVKQFHRCLRDLHERHCVQALGAPAEGAEVVDIDALARVMTGKYPMLAVIRALDKAAPGIRHAFAKPTLAPNPRVESALQSANLEFDKGARVIAVVGSKPSRIFYLEGCGPLAAGTRLIVHPKDREHRAATQEVG